MYMVTPSVYDKLLNCIDEKQQKVLNNLNQKTTNIFNETPASKFVKNISNDDFIQEKKTEDKPYGNDSDDDYPDRPDNYPGPMSQGSDQERNIPPGYRDDDFMPGMDEPTYEYDDFSTGPSHSMPVIEHMTPTHYHSIPNQPTHVTLPMEIEKPEMKSQSIQTEIPTRSQYIQTNIPTHSQITQTEIPAQTSKISQTDGPIYSERGTSPNIEEQIAAQSDSKKKKKKIQSSKQKKLVYKQPKSITFKRKKIKIVELPQEEVQPVPIPLQYESREPITHEQKTSIEYDKLNQKKLTTKQPKKLKFQRKKLVITEMEPDEEMQALPPIKQVIFEPSRSLTQTITLPIEQSSKKLPIEYESRLPITYKPKKAISHNKKEAIEYIKPLKRIAKHPNIMKEIMYEPSTSYQAVKIPSNIPQSNVITKKPPIKVLVPSDIPEITDQSRKIALTYVPKKSKKLENNPDKKPYPCTQCNLSYTTQFGLNRHNKNKHSNPQSKPQEKFETWLDYPEKRTSTYVKLKTPPSKFKRNQEFEAWN